MWENSSSSEAMIFNNCTEKPEKFRTWTGFEPVTCWYWCDALTNWAMKLLMFSRSWSFVGSNVPVSDEWIKKKWYCYMKWIIHVYALNCGYQINWSYMYEPGSYEHNFGNCLIFHHGNIRTHKWSALNVGMLCIMLCTCTLW